MPSSQRFSDLKTSQSTSVSLEELVNLLMACKHILSLVILKMLAFKCSPFKMADVFGKNMTWYTNVCLSMIFTQRLHG